MPDEVAHYAALAGAASASVKIIFDVLRSWRTTGHPAHNQSQASAFEMTDAVIEDASDWGVMDLHGHSDSTVLFGANSQVVLPSRFWLRSQSDWLRCCLVRAVHHTRRGRTHCQTFSPRSPVCRLRSFSTVLANASALAATACCLRRMLSFSTTEPHFGSVLPLAVLARLVYCSPSRLILPTRFAQQGPCAGRSPALWAMTTGKFVMGTLGRLSIRRLAV